MQLKGTKNGTSSTKTKRVVDFKLRVLSLKAGGQSAKEALEQACKEFQVPLTPGMIKHPHSFVNMYKASVNGLLKKGDKGVEAKVVALGLAESEAPKTFPLECPEAPEEEEPITDEDVAQAWDADQVDSSES